MLADGGIPRVITFGGQGRTQRAMDVPYVDDPTTGLRWVAMDRRFQNYFVPAMAQNSIAVRWVDDPDFLASFLALARLVNLELTAGAGVVLRAALDRLEADGH